MRLAITPRGPTLHFRVENFSLSKDVLKSQRHPKSSKLLYINAPLLVMNNFTTNPNTSTNGDASKGPPVPKHLENLITTVFQSLFPALNPQTTPLPLIKRVLLLNRELPSDPKNGSYTISLRHYAISTRPTGLSRPMKRLNQASRSGKSEARGKGVPNLGRLADVSEYLLNTDKGSYTSGSESEPDTDAEVEVLAPVEKKLANRDKKRKSSAFEDEDRGSGPNVERKAIKLAELGPRMRLRLIKVEEGLCQGKVLWHEFVRKSEEEEREMESRWEERKREKEERKRVQRENLERKRKEGGAKKGEDEGEDEKWDSDMLDAAEELEAEEQAQEDWEDEEDTEDEA